MGQKQSSGATIHGQRTIKLKSHMQRIDKDTKALLKTEFDRIQEAGVSLLIAQFFVNLHFISLDLLHLFMLLQTISCS